MKSRIPLCFYPTQIVFVDDNSEFLATLSMAFAKQFNVKTFDNTQMALKYINEQQREVHLVANDQKPKLHGESEIWVKQVLSHQNLRRFDEMRLMEVSVLVVDYSMPEMNGIEFCEQIKNSSVKKILLTGHATPMDAVRAFNDNTIHYYLRKSDDDMLDQLENAILQLQHAYFTELSSSIKAEAIDSGTPFFGDPELANYFQGTCDSLNISEYYYLTNPSRFLLHSSEGEKFMCIIYTEDDMLEHLKILSEEGADDELYAKIESREYVPFFKSADGYYEPDIINPLTQIYPAQKIQGKVNYYCSITSSIEVDDYLVMSMMSIGKLH